MTQLSGRIVAGIGFASAARAEEVLALVEASLAGLSRTRVEQDAARRLAEAGFELDYAVIRHPDLTEPAAAGDPAGAGPRVALVAARLGRTRLIDNLEFSC